MLGSLPKAAPCLPWIIWVPRRDNGRGRAIAQFGEESFDDERWSEDLLEGVFQGAAQGEADEAVFGWRSSVIFPA